MFRRRKQMSAVHQVRSVVGPERGFRRLFSYLFQRVIDCPAHPFDCQWHCLWSVCLFHSVFRITFYFCCGVGIAFVEMF